MEEAIRAFKDKVTGDQTAFQLATDKNEHYTKEDKELGRHYDPERFRGEIDDMEIRENRSDPKENGLWVRLDPNKAGNELIEGNKKLAVSASLEENVDHNGKSYPVVLRHVLGTLDAKVRDTGTWEDDLVSLSNESDKNKEVIDLTSTEVPTEEKDSVTVTKEWMDNVNKFMADSAKETEEANKLIDSWTNEPDDDDNEPEPANTQTDLSNAVNNNPRIIQLSNDLAESRFEKKADEWRRAGVPNAVIEKARGVLADGNDTTINLSNGTEIDNKEFVVSLIDEFKGTIDLSNAKTHQESQEEINSETEEEKMKEVWLEFFKKQED